MVFLTKNSSSFLLITLPFVSAPAYSQLSHQTDTEIVRLQSSDASMRLAANDSDTPENMPSAVVWYLEMAEQGDKDAQYNLGSIYETGFGVNIDMKEAVKWYSRAAQQGHQVSQLKLGMLYHLGKGAEQSTIKGNK